MEPTSTIFTTNNKRQNGCFKTELSSAKSVFYRNKRVHGLPSEMLPQDIVIVARTAIIKYFLDITFDKPI